MKQFIQILLLLLGATRGYPGTHPLENLEKEQVDQSEEYDEDDEELWEFIKRWS